MKRLTTLFATLFAFFYWGMAFAWEATCIAAKVVGSALLSYTGGPIYAMFSMLDTVLTRMALRRFDKAFPVVGGMPPYPVYDGGLRRMSHNRK